MIVVVEGMSASGKTTWCAKHAGQHVIPENGLFENVPNRVKTPVGAATFWAERNVERWQKALAMEDISSWSLCDSHPLKLHYIWCLPPTTNISGKSSASDGRVSCLDDRPARA